MHPEENTHLVIALRSAARALAHRRSIRDMEQTLGQIVAAAVDTVPAVDAASISITEHGRIETRHPTTDVITKLDQTQSELHEGPCISAIEDPPQDGIVVAADLAGDDAQRWPRFAPYAVEAGYLALLSTTLDTGNSARGALNLYSTQPHAFTDLCCTLAGLFGAQAALLLYGAEQAANLQKAVDTRDLIGQAKGIVMERFKIDEDAAFQMLVKASQDTNMKLAKVAQWVATEQSHATRLDGTAPASD